MCPGVRLAKASHCPAFRADPRGPVPCNEMVLLRGSRERYEDIDMQQTDAQSEFILYAEERGIGQNRGARWKNKLSETVDYPDFRFTETLAEKVLDRPVQGEGAGVRVIARGLGNLVADGNTEIHGSNYRVFRRLAGGGGHESLDQALPGPWRCRVFGGSKKLWKGRP
jgi:hypothetical protein